jgi:hypothetical protein
LGDKRAAFRAGRPLFGAPKTPDRTQFVGLNAAFRPYGRDSFHRFWRYFGHRGEPTDPIAVPAGPFRRSPVDRLEGHVPRRDPPDVEGLRGGLAEDRGEELVRRLVVDRVEHPRVHHRRGRVAEERPRPDLAVPVRLDERVVVEDHVAVGEDGREELPEEGGADPPSIASKRAFTLPWVASSTR